jgi:DNA mismatch repair protein MutL
VHPAKKEVRFHDSQIVREAVARAIQDTLNQSRMLPQGHPTAPRAPMGSTAFAAPAEQQASLALPAVEQTTLRRDWAEFQPKTHEVAPQLRAVPEPQRLPSMAAQPARPAEAEPVATSESSELTPVKPAATDSADDYRIMGVLNKLYVLMESKEGLVLMDQHAAHERVLFEKMRRSMETEGVPTQRLLLPLMLHVSPRDYDLLSRNLQALAKLGIEAEAFGANTFKIDSLPSFMATDDPLHLLNEVVEELSSLSSRSSSLRLGEDMIATTVCRHAVKANDYLREPELRGLLRELLVCEMPYCCPHGRPTLIQISYVELDRKFGRRAP